MADEDIATRNAENCYERITRTTRDFSHILQHRDTSIAVVTVKFETSLKMRIKAARCLLQTYVKRKISIQHE